MTEMATFVRHGHMTEIPGVIEYDLEEVAQWWKVADATEGVPLPGKEGFWEVVSIAEPLAITDPAPPKPWDYYQFPIRPDVVLLDGPVERVA